MLDGRTETIETIPAKYQELTFQKLFGYYGSKGIVLSDKTFIKNLGLRNEEGQFNLLAQLLSDDSHFPLRVSIFEGKTKGTNLFSVREFGNNCLLYSLDELLRYGDVLNIIQADETDRVVERKEVPLFDNKAFRETIINAVLHNKWTEGNEPMISVFSDRIEILSRGSLPPAQTMEGFYLGESVPVNEKLSEIFLQLHISEKSGRGVPKITEIYGKEAFAFRENSIVVTIPLKKIRKVGNKLGNKLGDKKPLNVRRRKILSEMRDNPNITAEELRKILGISKTAVDNNISFLRENGHIERVGSKKQDIGMCYRYRDKKLKENNRFMAAINDLIAQIQDVELRNKIEQEVNRMNKQKKFGLVFEEHLPECTPLYEMPVNCGSNVALKSGNINDVYRVIAINNEKALCMKEDEQAEWNIADLVVVAKFGEPIYPYLKQIDSVCNAPDSNLWHTLIEADNYHALQLLEYLYAGKVDCIYIDPPYNTGAKDWKYNNDYVDGNDSYRHSKWLSMMQKRLKLAKRLLNQKDSVLIVTIDEKEYLHLGCLLEELFPEARMQMITSVISAKGVVRTGQFSRVEEYIFIIEFGLSSLVPCMYNMLDNEVKKVANRSIEWLGFRRRAPQAKRESRPNQFYPIFVRNCDGTIHSIGDVVKAGIDRNTIPIPDGCTALWPLSKDGDERLWSLVPEQAQLNLNKGFLKINNWNAEEKSGTVYYLPSGTIQDIETGKAVVLGRNQDGSVIAQYTEEGRTPPKRVWNMKAHNAETYGTNTINMMIGKRFNYPKSIYAVHDTIRFFVANKPNALIVDFFAGSGTTLHAVNLLNAEDNGQRRCIMVTNNEVSVDEAKILSAKGLHPGDEEWDKVGIARYVTWPRTICSIEGHDINGSPLKGNYIGSNQPMAEGFKANAVFFKLGFLDKTTVALGRQFRELLPVIWMKAGAIGPCPTLNTEKLPTMMILSANKLAVLLDENYFSEFEEKVNQDSNIETVFIVTDYEAGYRTMIQSLAVENTYQLYRDYLDNFRINQERRQA